MVSGASPGPPRGLPGASLEPPGTILENMQRNAKKQEKTRVSPDPIWGSPGDPRRTPKSPRSGLGSGKEVKNVVFYAVPVGVIVLDVFFHRFSIDF